MTRQPPPPPAHRELEVMVPAAEPYLAVLRTTCTSIASGVGFPRTTIEVLRNALDSAASQVLYEWPEADEIHAVFRVDADMVEIDLFPRSADPVVVSVGDPGAPADLEEAAPRMCCARRRNVASDHVPAQGVRESSRVQIDRLDPEGLRVSRRITGPG